MKKMSPALRLKLLHADAFCQMFKISWTRSSKRYQIKLFRIYSLVRTLSLKTGNMFLTVLRSFLCFRFLSSLVVYLYFEILFGQFSILDLVTVNTSVDYSRLSSIKHIHVLLNALSEMHYVKTGCQLLWALSCQFSKGVHQFKSSSFYTGSVLGASQFPPTYGWNYNKQGLCQIKAILVPQCFILLLWISARNWYLFRFYGPFSFCWCKSHLNKVTEISVSTV